MPPVRLCISNSNMKKQHIISLIVTLLCLIAIPISILAVGFGLPAQYSETYYGELSYMFNRLKNGKEGKIVFVGNSALAFGVRSDLVSQEINREVVNFGLYGAIGTKAMMDLSKVGIKKNDIVILAPEISPQGLSLYFSAENIWYSVDGHYEMLNYIGKDNKEKMVGNYVAFASKKFINATKKQTINVEGVYTQSSFNNENGEEVGYMTYERPYNMMLNGFDSNSMITFNKDYLSDDFIDYVNDYASFINKKGASIFFGFVPMNQLAITSSKEDIDSFYTELQKKLNFPILGNPHQYCFDFDWFYDNNCHLNSSGVYIYNHQLVEDLKVVFANSSATNIDIPEKPVIPIPDFEEGDNSDIDCFNYEEDSDGYSVISLTEIGKNKTSLIIPSTYNDKPIISFKADVFKNNTTISEVLVPTNIRGLFDYSFDGCTNLMRIVLQNTDPNKINVGMALLDGAPNCNIYVKEAVYNNFVNHYNWGYYRNKLNKY